MHENQARMLMGLPQSSSFFSFFRCDRRESKDWQPTTAEINATPAVEFQNGENHCEGSWQLRLGCWFLDFSWWLQPPVCCLMLYCHYPVQVKHWRKRPNLGKVFVHKCLKRYVWLNWDWNQRDLRIIGTAKTLQIWSLSLICGFRWTHEPELFYFGYVI